MIAKRPTKAELVERDAKIAEHYREHRSVELARLHFNMQRGAIADSLTRSGLFPPS